MAERRELDAKYTVLNNTKKIIRLDFNTTQRIDILTFDPAGKVVEKWSEDRLFMLQEGVVIINPKERIEYSEKVATRDMKPSEPYTIKADVIGYPDYSPRRPPSRPLLTRFCAGGVPSARTPRFWRPRLAPSRLRRTASDSPAVGRAPDLENGRKFCVPAPSANYLLPKLLTNTTPSH